MSRGVAASQPAPSFDIVVRNGTVLDGIGGPGYTADVGISGGTIAAIGDLRRARAHVELDVAGLIVAPGFINIHSHATPGGLARASNMLTQGVTTEILNPDGGGTADVAGGLAQVAASRLAVNIGAYIGFNAVWQEVLGIVDRRPTPAELIRMRELVERGLEQGAWGVSAGLDYVPGRYATTEEVVRVVEGARKWRTNFPNHERPAEGPAVNVLAGISETLAIARAAGLMPVITHVKAPERGNAQAVTAMMSAATANGLYTAADVYPYLAGMTRLAALLIPGWAQEGGHADMVRRFAEPAQRARIVAETERTLTARFGGPEAVYLPTTREELVAVMQGQNVPAGEAIVRILENGPTVAILRFGVESDVVSFLRDPRTSIACDCGAIASTLLHPRFYGTFPRVLGRYVREQKVLTLPDAIRKMTALPAATIGMVDRGVLAVGMAADITIFDPDRVVDHATYEEPARLSEGIRHVIVNGRLALRDGRTTGEQAGRVVIRTRHMPSRSLTVDQSRRIVVHTPLLELDVQHDSRRRRATGVFRVRDQGKNVTIDATDFGMVQVAERWATFTGRARVLPSATERSFTAIVDQADPFESGAGRVWVKVEGLAEIIVPVAR